MILILIHNLNFEIVSEFLVNLSSAFHSRILDGMKELHVFDSVQNSSIISLPFRKGYVLNLWIPGGISSHKHSVATPCLTLQNKWFSTFSTFRQQLPSQFIINLFWFCKQCKSSYYLDEAVLVFDCWPLCNNHIDQIQTLV